jgi:HTH-type transcriptional regulator/antitoxin HipB
VRDVAALARGRRLDLGWSQAETARRAKVSRKWVSDVERGKEGVDLASVLRLLEALDIALESSGLGAGGAARGDEIDLDAFLREYGGP